MELLALSRRISILFGICSPSESNFWKEFRQIAIIAFVSLNLAMLDLAGVWYSFDSFEKSDITEFLFGCLHVAAVTSTLLSYISLAYNKRKMQSVFDRLQSAFNKREFPIQPGHRTISK